MHAKISSWIFLLEASIILTGNITVLVVFSTSLSLRKREYILIINQAIADLCVGISLGVTYVIQTLLEDPSQGYYRVYAVIDVFFGTTSVFGLAALAIERAHAIYYPFKHRALKKNSYYTGIAVLWIFSLLFALMQMLHLITMLPYTEITVVFISLFIITLSYSLIWLRMRRLTENQLHGLNRQLTNTFLIMTVISLIAWSPFQILNIILAICKDTCAGTYSRYFNPLIATTKILQYGNSIVNPIVYLLRMPQYKQALYQSLERCGVRTKSESGDGNQISDERMNELGDNAVQNGKINDDEDQKTNKENYGNSCNMLVSYL